MRAFSMGLGLVAWAAVATASERHFTYTYESSILQPGGRELEPWNTFRLGQDDFFAGLDTRLELEMGLSDRLQTSLYLNLGSQTVETSSGRESKAFQSLSSEWKLKLADPVADRVGLAVYGELTGGPQEAELEGKLILDKRVGRWLTAFNATVEHEWELAESNATQRETVFEIDAAGCYFLTPRVTGGLELRSHTVWPPEAGPARSALFLGPSLSYVRRGWWIAVSVLPQIRALSGASSGTLDLVEHQRVEARFIFGLEF